MESTDTHQPDDDIVGQRQTEPETDETLEHRWSTVGRQTLRVSAFLLWIGVGSYAWFRSMQPSTYMVGMGGATLGLTLAAVLFGGTTRGPWCETSTHQSTKRRLLVAGCLAGIVVGSVAVAHAGDQIGATQPTLSTLIVVGAALLYGSLLVVAARQSTALAGLASVGVVISLSSRDAVSLVEVGVFGAGIYGPLTLAAVTWIAPICLLVGCWRAAGTEQRLIALWNQRVERWTTTDSTAVRQLTTGVGCAVVLAGWQTGTLGSWAVVWLAAVPIGLVGVASVRAVTRDSISNGPNKRPSTTAVTASEWAAPALLVGGPLSVMALFAGGYQLPVGTVLAAGCLCCLGACLVRPYVDRIDGQSTGLQAGVGTILNGSLIGVQLLSRVLVPLLVVGGTVGLLEAAGVGTWLVAGVVWLSGGHPLGALVVVASCCVALGALLEPIGGYAVGALLGVPLVQLLGPVAELTAHLVVILAVIVGWLLVDSQLQITDIITTQSKP